jgi:hypothetical protein
LEYRTAYGAVRRLVTCRTPLTRRMRRGKGTWPRPGTVQPVPSMG